MEQGDVEIQGPRSTGVIIAIAALATLCVMGVASLMIYKLRLPAQPANTISVPASAEAAPDEEGSLGADDGAKAPPVTSDAEKKTDDEKPSDKPSDDGPSDDGPSEDRPSEDPKVSSGTPSGPAPGKATKDPGKLTINCKPACDQISADGIPLGPSPVFNRPLSPGQHRVTCTRGSKSKTIAVMITSGQLTSKTVRMD
jgi:hypothetical protein